MKILQIIQRPQLRGAEIFACQLSVHLQNLGHQVDILVLFGRPQEQALDFSLPFYFLEATEAKRFSDFKAYKNLAKFVQKGGYDVVQANAGDTLKYAALSKYLYQWKTPLVFRNANKISDFLRNSWHRRLNALWVKKCDGVISVSELCREDFIHTFRYPSLKIFTGTIGTNLPSNVGIPEDIKALMSKGPLVLHVGSFVPEKNHQGLLRIFKKVSSQFPDVQLLLVGKGKCEQVVHLHAAALGLSSQIHFLGWRKDIPGLMEASSTFLLPSLIEGLPGVILEAQAMRVPVIAYNVGGVSEVVQHRQTGYLIKKGAEQAFAEAVLEVLAQPSQQVILLEKAYQQVATHYDNKVIAQRFLELYAQLTVGNPASGQLIK